MDTYEKKYKEANDKIAARFGTNVAKEIFTDLYESEDEKVISTIKKALEAKIEDLGNGVTKTACLAWLEKQQKPAWNEEGEKIRKEIMDFIDTKTIDSDERRNRWFSYLEKYKPISFISLEDTKVKMSLIQYISELNQDVVHLHPGIETCNEWIAWLEKQGEKPQRMISAEAKEAMYDKPAWSEDDEKTFVNLISYGSSKYTGEQVIEWLNSLKQRMGGK